MSGNEAHHPFRFFFPFSTNAANNPSPPPQPKGWV
jgi:hypothetical protein